jgi:hypothetical protein
MLIKRIAKIMQNVFGKYWPEADVIRSIHFHLILKLYVECNECNVSAGLWMRMRIYDGLK